MNAVRLKLVNARNIFPNFNLEQEHLKKRKKVFHGRMIRAFEEIIAPVNKDTIRIVRLLPKVGTILEEGITFLNPNNNQLYYKLTYDKGIISLNEYSKDDFHLRHVAAWVDIESFMRGFLSSISWLQS